MPDPIDLAGTFVVLTPKQGAEPVAFSPETYAELDRRYDGFRGHSLVACHAFEGDWPSWEIHPAGDELVIHQAGSIDMVLWTRAGEETARLDTPGQCLVVPRGTWHTGRAAVGATLLFVTPGEGTVNAESPHELD